MHELIHSTLRFLPDFPRSLPLFAFLAPVASEPAGIRPSKKILRRRLDVFFYRPALQTGFPGSHRIHVKRDSSILDEAARRRAAASVYKNK
jgi:hypothetical protein